MNNLKLEQFRQAVSQLISKSGLDVGTVYFIMKDITREVESLYFQQVQKENEEMNKEKTDEE